MATGVSLAVVVLLVSGVVSAASAVETWRRRNATARTSLALVMMASSVWSLAYAMEAAVATPGARELWGAVKYLGVAALPAAWLIFTIQYSGGGRRVRTPMLIALAIGPTLLMVLLALPGTRDLIRSYPPGNTPLPVIRLGPLFWPWFAYSVAVISWGTIPLVLRLLRTSQLYRRQVRLILAALTLVLIANLLTNVGVGIFRRFDPTPVALSISGVLLVWGIVRFRLVELLPAARTTLVETMSDAVLVTDAQHRVVDLNPAAQRIIGPASTVVGRPVGDLLDADVPGSDDAILPRRELVLRRDEGDLHFELLVSHLDDGRGGHAGDLLVLRDITERKRAERDLEHIAHHDDLTGLPNRLLFTDRMEQALVRARRNSAQLAVLFLDINQFKAINDGLGHDLGDRVLIEVARRLARSLRAGDALARLGGDEFSVVLPEIDQPENAAIVAAKLLRAIAEPLKIDDQQLHVTASIGIAVFPQDGQDQRGLMSRADGAMYAAKAKGSGGYEFSSPEIQARADHRKRFENQLRQALSRTELFLEYQPIVNLTSGSVVAFEALVRWKHPELGDLTSERFMNWAEEIRLAPRIDRWVLGAACRQAASWQAADRRILISVNLSPLTILDADLRGAVAAALDRSGLDPSCLCLGLNEQSLSGTGEAVAERLSALKAMGLSVALDHFGVGSTSLSQIGHLPLDILKIDSSIVEGLGNDVEMPIIAAMVNVAHIMGLDVVAEGVERADQLPDLRDLGCEMGQGLVFAPPLPPERASAIVADHEDRWPGEPGGPWRSTS